MAIGGGYEANQVSDMLMLEAKGKVLEVFLEAERKGLPVVDIVYLLAEFQQDYTVRLRGEIAHYQIMLKGVSNDLGDHKRSAGTGRHRIDGEMAGDKVAAQGHR